MARRIIKGVLYDTETSTLIYFDEDKRRSYYVTPKNKYFVVFATGEIQVKTTDSIKELLGERDIDKYIELFGKPEEA